MTTCLYPLPCSPSFCPSPFSPAPVISLSPLLLPSPIPPPSFSYPLSLSSPSPSSPPPLSPQMLTSVLGMLETTRQAVTMLKERVMTTQAELERKEVCLLSPSPSSLSMHPSLHPSLPSSLTPSLPLSLSSVTMMASSNNESRIRWRSLSDSRQRTSSTS